MINDYPTLFGFIIFFVCCYDGIWNSKKRCGGRQEEKGSEIHRRRLGDVQYIKKRRTGQETDKQTPLLSQRIEEVSSMQETGLNSGHAAVKPSSLPSSDIQAQSLGHRNLMLLGLHQHSLSLGDFPPHAPSST